MLDLVIGETLGLSNYKPLVICNSETKSYVNDAQLDSVTLIENKKIELGMLHSIQEGLRHTPADAMGFMIVLADMPYLKKTHYSFVLEEFRNTRFEKITYPLVGDQAGHPVCFPSDFAADVLDMHSQDRGLKKLIESHSNRSHPIISNDIRYLKDVDTMADLL